MSSPHPPIQNLLLSWTPPPDWKCIRTLDAHCAGEPIRIILGGFDGMKGNTMLERRHWAVENIDRIRTSLMWEPRGHREMYGCFVTDPVTDNADFGVLFLHNEGFSTMCGHGVIAVATVAVQVGLVTVTEPETVVRIDTPAGLVTAHIGVKNGNPGPVRFHNVPSYVEALDQIVEVPGFGPVTYDLAFGGAYYAYVQAQPLGLKCTIDELPRLVALGMDIKRAIMGSRAIKHPFDPEMGFLYGTIFIAPPLGKADSRNVCIFADGQVDRSPTGTGVSGRLALEFARGKISVGDTLVIESVIGTIFAGTVVRATTYGMYAAVIPEVMGSASITGRHEFLIDPRDPLKYGFLV